MVSSFIENNPRSSVTLWKRGIGNRGVDWQSLNRSPVFKENAVRLCLASFLYLGLSSGVGQIPIGSDCQDRYLLLACSVHLLQGLYHIRPRRNAEDRKAHAVGRILQSL